jgi:hypothetical protein
MNRDEIDTRDARAVELRTIGRTWQTIADELGYAHRGHAQERVSAFLARRRGAGQSAQAFREMELAKLDRLEQAAWDVLLADHPVIQGGQIVGDIRAGDDGRVILQVRDDGPVLRAIAVIVKLAERRAKLQGLDEPERVEATIVAEVEAHAGQLLELLNGALADADLTAAQQMRVRSAAAARLRALSA